MPNQLSESRMRICIAINKELKAKLDYIAVDEALTLSGLINNTVARLVRNYEKENGEITEERMARRGIMIHE